jgi:hypothetical protein
MDLIFLLIGFCLLAEFFYFVSNIDRLPPISKKNKLIIGLLDLGGTVVMIVMLNKEIAVHFSYEDLIIPTLGLKLKGWFVAILVIIGLIESLILIIYGSIEMFRGIGGHVTKGIIDTSAVKPVAKLLNLNPSQTIALAYIFKHKSITIEDFQLLCPEIERSSLEQDLQALVRLGLAVNEGDKFIIT